MNRIRDRFTWQLLLDSGIEKGMRVLDVGCGTGDLSMMAAELVGETGAVLGVDVAESALQAAEQSARESSILSVAFRQADILRLPKNIGRFDAIIGRRVLMYQSDAAKCIRGLLAHLVLAGKMVFQESDRMAALSGAESLPLHTKVQAWIWDTVEKEGGNVHIGMQLYQLMKHAGMTVSDMRAQAVLHTAESGSDLGWVAKMMQSRITGQGVATADELDTDTLQERLQAELKECGVPFFRDMAFGICAVRC